MRPRIAAPQRANISHIPQGNMLALALGQHEPPARSRQGAKCPGLQDFLAGSTPALFVQLRPEREAWMYR
jgi:hypothetical protein